MGGGDSGATVRPTGAGTPAVDRTDPPATRGHARVVGSSAVAAARAQAQAPAPAQPPLQGRWPSSAQVGACASVRAAPWAWAGIGRLGVQQPAAVATAGARAAAWPPWAGATASAQAQACDSPASHSHSQTATHRRPLPPVHDLTMGAD